MAGLSSYTLLAVSLGVFVTLLTFGAVAARVTIRERFDLIDIFILAFGAIYGVGYAFVILATDAGVNATGMRILGNEPRYWIVPVLSLVCVAGYLAMAVFAPADPDEHCSGESNHVVDDEVPWLGLAKWLAWAFLVVALFSSWLYTRAYGGIAGFFEVAGALRAGLFEEAGANPLSFLKPFGGFSIFATYLFAATFLASGRGQRSLDLIGLVAALVVSIVTMLGWGGRVDLLVYGSTLILGALIYRYGVSARLLAAVSLIVAALLGAMPMLTDVMNPGKSRGSYAAFFATELTFPVESTLNSLDLESHRWGADVLAAPLFILPERLWGRLDIRTVSDINSERLLGDRLREGFGYTIPADFITFGLFQFGLAGPLVLGAIWCFVLIRLDSLIVNRIPRALSAFIYSHAVFSVAALSVLYVDPKMQIARNFDFIFGLVAVLALPWVARLLGKHRSGY